MLSVVPPRLPLMPGRSTTPAVELQVGERTVRVTSPDKLYFPEVGLTKIAVVEYVLAVG
jgi:hypothetical protein